MTSTPATPRIGVRLLAAFGLSMVLAGCATGPDPRDPLEPFNRRVMDFNEGVDSVVLKPVATVYREVVPPLARTGVSNFFSNLTDAWSSVNNLLQFRFQYAAESFMRFNVNTFMGLGGILDVASEMNIERHREDFGQTLGRWGLGAGPYIVLPLLGPSTLRDTLALPVDLRMDPVRQVAHAFPRNSLYGLRAVDVRSNLLRASAILDGAALDKYSFTRDAHLQRRRAEVFEGTRHSLRDDAGSDASSTLGGSPALPSSAAETPPVPPATNPAGLPR